jgi:hypothetical protein
MELTIVGSTEHSRREAEARCVLGLDQRVIAPFAVLEP